MKDNYNQLIAPSREFVFAIGEELPLPNSIVIKCEHIYLQHTSLNIIIEVSNSILEKYDVLEINGFKFVKEKENGTKEHNS